MELQEAVLKAVISEIRFEPTPRFPEVRAELIERLRDAGGLDNWAMSEQFVQIFTEGDPRALLQVSIGNLSTSFENMGADECRAATGRTIETALDALGLKTATYIGVRSSWLAATDDFDQLNEWLIENIGGAAPHVLEPVGQKPSDSGWVFEFRSSEPEHLLRVGPMKEEQATSQLRDKEPGNYPPQFLLIDLDRQYKTVTQGVPAVVERWGSAFDRCLAVAEQVVGRLRSLL